MNNNKKSIIQEIAIIMMILFISFFLFNNFDVLEKIVEWSRKYERYEIDELVSTSVVLVFLSLLVLIRRWHNTIELNDMLSIKNKKLQGAMDEIKQLKGILPLCSFCKKIRNDAGYWEQVDIYIKKYSAAEISHSICPECMKKQYPEEYALIYSETNKK